MKPGTKKGARLHLVSPSNPRTEENFWKTLVEDDKERLEGFGPCWNRTTGFYTSGHSAVIWEDKTVKAHALAYFFVYGVWVKQLNHYCHNAACSHPLHVYEGTQSQNALDSRDSGLREDFKLSKKIADDIRYHWFELKVRPQKKIAEKFGVSQPTISMIINNRIWL